MHHHSLTIRSAARRVLVFATALAALAVAAPLANAARSHTLACQEDPGQWVSVTDEQGVSTLTLVGGTVCTQAVTGRTARPRRSARRTPAGSRSRTRSAFRRSTKSAMSRRRLRPASRRPQPRPHRQDGVHEPAVQLAAAEVPLSGMGRRLRRPGGPQPRADLALPLDRSTAWGTREPAPGGGLSALQMPTR
jgi:hypothetical protein